MNELGGPVAHSVLPVWFVIVSASAFGLAIGSFLNVVVYRLPRGESLSKPGSHCPFCGTAVAMRDNVPVLSFLWLGGRCRDCRSLISLRYPALELLTGAVFGLIASQHGAVWMTPLLCVFAAALIAAAAVDIDHRIIPDEISLGGLVAALLLVPSAAMLSGAGYLDALMFSAAGAALGGGTLWLIGFSHARLSVAQGRTFAHWPGEGEPLPRPASLDYWTWFPGLGFGDVKLLAMIGAVLGPFQVLETILVSAAVGLVLGVGWALVTGRWNAPFGFGPAIAVGALLVVLLPDGFASFWVP
jgi:leader peptidase (prepilin peptidase)/N-methyltransferase